MQAAPREDAGENVAGGGDALPVLAADADCEIYFRDFAIWLFALLCWAERA